MDHAHVIPPSGGTPWIVDGEVITCKADIQLAEPHLQIFIVEGARKAEQPPHTHQWDEVVVVLDGELELQTGLEVHLMVRGSVGVAPAGCVHDFRTVSQTSRYLAITSTDQAAGFYAHMSNHNTNNTNNTESRDQ
jgi:quercetin dioxygenase-like cupin family protein